MLKKQNRAGYLFITPLIIIFSVFFLYSFYFMIRNGFFKVNISLKNPVFVGLDNYRMLFTDPRFIRALFNTLLFAFLSILAGITIGFILSILLSFTFRGKGFFHTLFFVPVLMPLALIAEVFAMMLEYRYGTFNELLRFLHLDFLALRWLALPGLAYLSVIALNIYLIGLPIMYYTADLASMDLQMLEAAEVDGAGMFRKITGIIFPALINSHKTVTLSVMLSSFRAFETVFLLTKGGPGYSTEITGTYLYSFAASGINVGYVSAASVVILILAFVISFLQIQAYKRK